MERRENIVYACSRVGHLGKDLGDDPTADGTGAELGIKDICVLCKCTSCRKKKFVLRSQDSPPLEGVRGFKLMEDC